MRRGSAGIFPYILGRSRVRVPAALVINPWALVAESSALHSRQGLSNGRMYRKLCNGLGNKLHCKSTHQGRFVELIIWRSSCPGRGPSGLGVAYLVISRSLPIGRTATPVDPVNSGNSDVANCTAVLVQAFNSGRIGIFHLRDPTRAYALQNFLGRFHSRFTLT